MNNTTVSSEHKKVPADEKPAVELEEAPKKEKKKKKEKTEKKKNKVNYIAVTTKKFSKHKK